MTVRGEGLMPEALCSCPPWLARQFSDEFIWKVERLANTRWLCVYCKRPLIPSQYDVRTSDSTGGSGGCATSG